MPIFKAMLGLVMTIMTLGGCVTATVSEKSVAGLDVADGCAVVGAKLDMNFPSGNMASCKPEIGRAHV